VLAVMGPERLERVLFPLGDATAKSEVRAEAAARGLAVSAKPDSYDICFVADGDTQGFLRDRLGSQPGDIRDTDGTVLGTHDGTYGYTVGQRKGLALGRPAADGRPRYVLSIEPVSRTVVVGSAAELEVGGLLAGAAVWFGPLGDGHADGGASSWTRCTAQVRAHGAAVPARARALPDGRLEVDVTGETGGPRLAGIAAGQSVVLYDGTRVLGQATVESTRSAVLA